jgi:hypothetical protein
VAATVEYIYERGGATPSEAACIARITARRKHAVNQAFEAITDAQTAAFIACVGSERKAINCVGSVGRFHELVFTIPAIRG